MTIKAKLFPILAIVLAVSCRSETASVLDRAEALLSDRPDSALALIESIPRSNLNTEGKMARYALLKSWALDKNYIDVASDSLTRLAVDYYSIHGDKKHRMLAWYYHSLVQKNAQSYTASIISLEEAEKDALTLMDYHSLGLINRNKANVFSLVNNYAEAIRYRKKAVAFFEKAQETPYRSYAELNLAIEYVNNQSFDKADSLFNNIRRQYNDTVLNRYCDLHQACILAELDKDPDRVIDLYERVSEEYYGVTDYGYKAISYESLSHPDSANLYFEKGYAICQDQIDSASIDYMKSKVEMRRGNYAEAFRLVDCALSTQDSLTRVLLRQSVSSAQRDFYKSEARWKEEKIRAMRVKTIFGTLLALLLVSIFIMVIVSRSHQKDRQLQDQMARLALQERQLERVNRDNAHLVGSLFSEKISHLDKLAESYFRMENGKQKDLVFAQIKQLVSTVRNDDDLFLSLEKDLDRYCDGIMSKLREQVPRIKGENLRMIMLFFAGFSYETVMIILNKNSIESLKMARSRFRKEIREADAPDADFFLKMLEMK